VLSKWTRTSSAIDIGDDVWLGAGAIILKGVTLGDGCVVASGSVVTSGSYPPRSLLAGNPAKIIRELHDCEACR
jgi:acetyltransferase-like isoleucine patch superfamily enzyme